MRLFGRIVTEAVTLCFVVRSEPLELSSVNAVKEDLDVLVYSNEEVDETQ